MIQATSGYGVTVRDRSEMVILHGSDGQLEAAPFRDGAQLRLSYLFFFLGASPCTDLVRGAVSVDRDGFVQTGSGGDGMYETSVPGVYAAGDVRSGSPKRCATAVGEGAAVVRLVHERMPAVSSTPGRI